MTRTATTLLALIALLLGACAKSSTGMPGTGSQTHWLTACQQDAECGDLSCVCSVCVEPCANDGTCAVEGLTTTCHQAGSTAVQALCGAAAPMPLCLQPCSGVQCEAGLSCVDGACVGKKPSPHDAGTREAGTGDASARDAGATDAGPAGGCDYNGVHYDIGDGFRDADDCNDCSCTPSGVVCTLKACLKDAGTTTGLRWYETCGAPVCGGPGTDGPTGEPLCTTQVAGGGCSNQGELCDPSLGCSVNLVCAASDPTMGPVGCPISRARYKDDVRYLSEPELSRVANELLSMPLAHWRYKHDDSGAQQMGFIIEDVEPSPSVAGDRVNLYGYTSMAVAALQVQSAQLRALEHEVEQLRGYLLALPHACESDAR